MFMQLICWRLIFRHSELSPETASFILRRCGDQNFESQSRIVGERGISIRLIPSCSKLRRRSEFRPSAAFYAALK